MNNNEIISEINRLKKEKDAVIVAHTYQIGEIQDIADMVGDSYALSKFCAQSDKKTIVFCGVHFMAESAKILSPEKKVLLPERNAGCPMADMITADSLRKKKSEMPGVTVVTYINSSAEVKAESDVIVTSSNALKIVKALPDKKILFTPDQNLGSYIAKQCPEKEIVLWSGYCPTHHKIKKEDVIKVKSQHPNALLLIHPECPPEILEFADFIGSTKDIVDFAKKSSEKEFIIGTEMGVLHPMINENPDKKFYLMSPGLICPNMKKTTLESVYNCLQKDYYEIALPEDVMNKARVALNRMLELAK